jgi:DNA polymerase-1
MSKFTNLGRAENMLPKPNMKYITNEEDGWEALTFIDRYPVYALDTETTALDPYEAKLSLLQIGVPDHSFVFDLRYDTEYSSLHPSFLDPILQDEKKTKILQNASYDMKIIKVNMGYYLNNMYDTMLAEQLLNLGLFAKANLQALVQRYMGLTLPKEPRSTFADYYQKFEPYQLEYAANDVVPLHLIRELQSSRIQKESLEGVLQLESDFLVPLCEMELNGILIDVERWRSMMSGIERERDDIKKIINDMLRKYEDQNTLFGASLVNVDSQQQLKKALLKQGLELENTSEGELVKYKGLPVVDAILDYRKCNKLVSTYSESLLEKISPYTGRLHTDFRQMVSTGRMSSSNPNLQNIPKKQKFRSCFVAPDDYVLLTADMSSAELRILGNLSKDPVFLDCFKNNMDLHTRSACEIFRVTPDKVDKKMRNSCKALSFGLMYGLSKYGLSKRLDISEKDAQDLIDNYFGVFKSVKRYLDKSASDGVNKGYSVSIAGRRRYYNKPTYDSPDKHRILRGIKRQAMNMPIQSSNADTIKKAMIYIVKRLKEQELPARLILTVHDEVVVETKKGYEQEVGAVIEQGMIDGFGDYFEDIPMESDVLEGPCWLKDACETPVNGKKCGSTKMVFGEDKDGKHLICSKCGALQE